MSSSILHPVQYRFLNNGCIHWNTTKSPTQQKSGYLVSSTAFWIADFFWSCFFGNQEVYHVFLGNMIKTILKPTKITISSCFFCRKSHGDGIRPSNQFQPPGPTICLAACSCTQRPWHATKPLHASNFLLDDQRMLCQFGHLSKWADSTTSSWWIRMDMNELFVVHVISCGYESKPWYPW